MQTKSMQLHGPKINQSIDFVSLAMLGGLEVKREVTKALFYKTFPSLMFKKV